MKCQEVNRLLLAYLDNEVTPSERMLIQAHLAGCDTCQQELAALSALQSRVGQFLHIRAAQATPSPQAWSRLQARLAEEARPPLPWLPKRPQRPTPGAGRIHKILGGMTMKKGLAFAAIAALVIALSVMAFVPSVRAQVGQLLRWFRFESPAGGGEVSIPGSVEFTPLRPAYLPAGFQAMAVGLNPEAASLNYWNSATNQILIIDQRRSSPDDDRSLPPGTSLTVNGQPAVLITDVGGSVTFTFLSPTPAVSITPPANSDQTVPLEPVSVPVETISYTDGRRLVWYVGDVRVEMLSNLPVEEMLRVAESMIPAEEGPVESNP